MSGPHSIVNLILYNAFTMVLGLFEICGYMANKLVCLGFFSFVMDVKFLLYSSFMQH